MKKLFFVCMLQFGFCYMYGAEIEYHLITRTELPIKKTRQICAKKVLKYMLIREFCKKNLRISNKKFFDISGKFFNFLLNSEKKIQNKNKEIPPKLTLVEKILSGKKASYCADTTIGCAVLAPFIEGICWISTGCNMSNAALWGLAGGYAGAIGLPCVVCGLYTCAELCCSHE